MVEIMFYWTAKFPIHVLGLHQLVVAQLVGGLFSYPLSFVAEGGEG